MPKNRIDVVFSRAERYLLRTALFLIFAVELVRFVIYELKALE